MHEGQRGLNWIWSSHNMSKLWHSSKDSSWINSIHRVADSAPLDPMTKSFQVSSSFCSLSVVMFWLQPQDCLTLHQSIDCMFLSLLYQTVAFCVLWFVLTCQAVLKCKVQSDQFQPIVWGAAQIQWFWDVPLVQQFHSQQLKRYVLCPGD